MSQIQDGQLIEGVLTLLDTDPIINPIFNCPAIATDNLARILQVHPGKINSDQVCKAIIPLAETLFPTPRIPIPRLHKGTEWLVFEETTRADEMRRRGSMEQKKVNRRTTMTSYGNIGRLDVQVDVPQLPPTSSGSSGGGGQRSFFKPLLLKKKKRNKVEEEPSITQMDNVGSQDDIPHYSKDMPKSPYDENDFIADYAERIHPSGGDMRTADNPAEGISGGEVELQKEADGEIRHRTETPDTPFSPQSISQQSISGPITPIIPDTPIPNEPITPFTPHVPITPITPFIPNSPIVDVSISESTHSVTNIPSPSSSSPKPTSSGKANNSHFREEVRDRPRYNRDDKDQQRHRHRHRTSKERDHQSYQPLKNANGGEKGEDSWLEITLKDLPFGPDRTMIRAIHSIQNDWKLFLAEIICLVGLAYILQRSGW